MPRRPGMPRLEGRRVARAGAALLCLIAVLGLVAGPAAAQGQRDLKSIDKEIKRREAAAGRSLAARRADLAATLAALQRLALRPPEWLIASPREAHALVRSGLLLRAGLPALRRRIAVARRRGAAIRRTTAKLAGDRARLAGLLGKHRTLPRRAADQRAKTGKRLSTLAAEASGLRDLLRRVRRQTRPRQAPPSRSKPIGILTTGGGRITLPVRGRIVRRFGQRTASGTGSKGIVIQARRGARVVAPFAGRIVFAGPFRDYGKILIIAHGGGYHTLVAGLGRIDVSVNQRLVAREPVGVMSLTQSDNTKLYLELRRNGRPINPLPRVAAKNE